MTQLMGFSFAGNDSQAPASPAVSSAAVAAPVAAELGNFTAQPAQYQSLPPDSSQYIGNYYAGGHTAAPQGSFQRPQPSQQTQYQYGAKSFGQSRTGFGYK
jgi:hypothetical protein